MSTKHEDNHHDDTAAPFAGFTTPEANWFRMPNTWVDISAGITNLAELKVVEYVLRHTWGYREYDIKKHITVDEFIRGRKRRDGSRMDRGTGLAEQSVRNGLAAAKQHGYLEEFVDDSDRARIKKYYGLKMRPDDTPGAGPASENESDASPVPPQILGSEAQDLDPGVQKLVPSGPNIRPRTETTTQLEPFERRADSTIALAQAEMAPNTSASESPNTAERGTGPDPTAAQRIQATITELSRTFGDAQHHGSNTAQATNLYLVSGLSIDAFEQRLFEAGSRTRDELHRRRRNPDAEPIRRPMAFYFATLRDLLGAAREGQAAPASLTRQGRTA